MPDRSMTTTADDFIAELVGLGFELAETKYDESHFGDSVVTVFKGNLRVRVVRDRGVWLVQLSPGESNEWFSPMVWNAYLNRDIGSLTTPDFSEQCRITIEGLERVEAMLGDPHLVGQLRVYSRERYAAQRSSRND